MIVLAVSAAASRGEPSDAAPLGLPARWDQYLTRVVRPGSDDRQRLARGGPVTKLLEADASKEVAVFGAIWVNAPVARYVAAVKDIESFERGGGFLITKRISQPPVMADFAKMQLTDEDFSDLASCRVGDCDVKLGEAALERFRTGIDWRARDAKAQADALLRRIAFEYVTGYLEGGNDRLAVYRDGTRPTSVAEEFRAMVDAMPELKAYVPGIREYLLGYPRVALPGSSSFLYWQEVDFGLKPTIRISHLTIREGADETVVVSKMLYASHYFWTGIELRVLVPAPSRGPGFWLITVNRSRSDGLSGFKGLFVRRRVRRDVQEGLLEALRNTKKRLEGPPAQPY